MRAHVEHRKLARVVAAAARIPDEIRIGGIGPHPRAVAATDAHPIAVENRTRPLADARRTPRRVILKTAADLVWYLPAVPDVIDLADRDVVAPFPRCSAILRNSDAAVIAVDDTLAIRRPPDVMVVAMH